jgi:hypothetical protein
MIVSPLALPQQSPEPAFSPRILQRRYRLWYDRSIKTYSVPELTPHPAPLSGRDLGRAIRNLGDAASSGLKPQHP